MGICVLSSCSYGEEEKAIDAAKESEIVEINDAKKKAMSDVQESINSVITSAIDGANEDLSLTVNDAKNEIRTSAKTSVNQSFDEKIKDFEKELVKARITALIAALVGFISLIITIVSSILMKRSTNRNEIIETVIGSQRIRSLVVDLIENRLNEDIIPLIRDNTSRRVISNEVRRYFESQSEKQVNSGRIGQDNKPVESIMTKRPSLSEDGKSLPDHSRVELYAKDSPNTILSGVTSVYLQGISIYRLVLSSPDAQTAEISVCTDKEQVKSRVLKSSNDLLEPVCRVDRKRSNHNELSTVTITAGKAEKITSDTWKVVEPIIVELS